MKLRATELFPMIGGEWYEQKSEWRFPRFGRKVGSEYLQPILRFRYLEDLRDIRLYEGHSYPWIGVDELGDWEDPQAFFRLLTINRYGRYPIPFKRIRATGNPGGRGHQWIKKYFVDPAPQGSKVLYDEQLKCNYLFILGTYLDNKIGLMNDPDVPNRMNRAGSPALVKALKEGDFNVVAGAYFLFESRHIIQPFEIAPHWTRFMAMDWGSCGDADPFSIGWWAVSDGVFDDKGLVPHFPRGHLVRFREWYGAGMPKVTVDVVAQGIRDREVGDVISYRVAGGDIGQKRGTGPSIAEMFSSEGIHFQRADMRRIPGWQLMNNFLGADGKRAGISVFNSCVDSVAVIPAMQHDPKDANDVEEANDHIADEWRYACMSRAWPKDKVDKKPDVKQSITWDELLRQNEIYE